MRSAEPASRSARRMVSERAASTAARVAARVESTAARRSLSARPHAAAASRIKK
jgi:hypothetical protein